MAPPQSSTTMQMAVRTKVAPRSSRDRGMRKRRILGSATGYELGFEIWRTSVDEIVDGVMMPIPGRSGNRGLELYL